MPALFPLMPRRIQTQKVQSCLLQHSVGIASGVTPMKKPSTPEQPVWDPAKLPVELRSRGRPLSVHRPFREAIADFQRRLLTRIFGKNLTLTFEGTRFERAVL